MPSERLVSVTDREADILMMICGETPTLVKRMEKIKWPVTELELVRIQEKFRRLVWDFHWERQTKKKLQEMAAAGSDLRAALPEDKS